MTYSDSALRLGKVPVGQQERVTDRNPFLYFEYARVVQDRTGIVALFEDEGELVRVPIAATAQLILGPGTSITHEAARTSAESGTIIQFTGGGGYPLYTSATPLTSTSKWAHAQARMWSNRRHLMDAARALYELRFPAPTGETQTLRQLRGYEGAAMHEFYKTHTRRAGVKTFTRNPKSDDPINTNLNIGNGILYGLARSICSALSVNPALGVIHRGSPGALLYDLADIYKPTITIPAAFAHVDGDNRVRKFRTEVRRRIDDHDVPTRMYKALTGILTPHLNEDDDQDLLISAPQEATKPGHTNYGAK